MGMMGIILNDISETDMVNKESKEVVQEILNDAIRYAVMSTETGSPPSWKEYIKTNQGVGNFTSPLTQPVPANSPTDLTMSEVSSQQAEPAVLNRALSEAFNKLPKVEINKFRSEMVQELPRSWHEKQFQQYSRQPVYQHEEKRNFSMNHFNTYDCVEHEIKSSDRIISELDPMRCPEFVPRSTNSTFNPVSHTKLNPNAPPFQTQNPDSIRATIDNLNCMKMSNRENEQPIRNTKLETEIKKLIKEIQDIDFGVRQSTEIVVAEGQGDVELEDDAKEAKIIEMELCEESLTQKIMELEKNSSLPTEPQLLKPITINESPITKKSCQMDLINQHKIKTEVDLPTVDHQLYPNAQDQWEESQEKEMRVINPEYSSSNSESELITPHQNVSDLSEIDLSLDTEEPSSGGKGDQAICDQVINDVLSAPPNTPEVHAGDDLNSVVIKETSIEKLTVSNDGQSPSDKKNKKKKWTFGNRILSLFSKNKHSATSGVVSDIKKSSDHN